jgi:hypothetical protein
MDRSPYARQTQRFDWVLPVNRRTSKIRVLAVCATLCLPAAALAKSAPNQCDERQLQAIPSRSPTAPNGREFARQVEATSEHDREQAIEAELLAGNIPSFLRRLVPVSLGAALSNGRTVQVTICVLPDYLAIGSDLDFLLVPMRLATALAIATRYGFTLPTTKMVDAIYEQSIAHLAPQPLPAGDRMRSTDYYVHHTQIVREQAAAIGVEPGALTAGDKKDLVITNRLWANLERVAIYGWHRLDHNPIQPLSTVHGARYADYSHGVRLVSTIVYVDGEPRSIFDALTNTQLAPALNREGPIPRLAELLAILATPAIEAANASPGSGGANAGVPLERAR